MEKNTSVKCPSCKEVFKVDDTVFTDIVKQVRDRQFEEEVNSRLAIAEREKASAIQLTESQVKANYQELLAKKDQEISELRLKSKTELVDEVSKKDETTFELETWLSNNKKIKAITKDDYFITLNKKDIRNLKISLVYDGPIVAPVQKDDKVADLIVYNKNDVVKKLPLYAAEDLKKVNFFKSLATSINYLIWGDV